MADISSLIHVEDEFINNPDHFSWIGDLQTTWDLVRNGIDPGRIDWNTDIVNRISDFSSYAGVRKDSDTAELSSRVFCVGNDGEALSSAFGAPILYSHDRHPRDELLGYDINTVKGERLDESITLDDVFDDLNLPENTPVYRAFFFLPVPLEGASYETNFFPMITTTKYDAANYLITENNLINVGQVSTRSHGRKLMNIDDDDNEFYHKATFTPDAAEDGKIILPLYEGRMIIISVPIQVKGQLTEFKYRGPDFRPDDYFDTEPALRTKGVSVDTVSISQGMGSKNQSARVDAEQIDYLPTIYDIRCLGVRRDTDSLYTPENIKYLFKKAYSVPTFGV